MVYQLKERELKPKLRILKGKPVREHALSRGAGRRSVRFAVVDGDKTSIYPANFLCILPQHMNIVNEDTSIFTKMFKESRIDLAKRLLIEALGGEEDPEIKREITMRLRELEPKPTWQRGFGNNMNH